MQRKLNEEFIRSYSKEFSSNMSATIFANQETVSGKEILSITASKQLNFFILKRLFTDWQDEMKQLESPYFDYRNPEVRRAMVDFMNTLSQHIEIGEKAFTELLEDATFETLHLAADPANYLYNYLQDKTELSEKLVKPFIKYLKLYKTEITQFFKDHLEQELPQSVDQFDRYFRPEEVDEVLLTELEHFSTVVAIEDDELFEYNGDEYNSDVDPEFEEENEAQHQEIPQEDTVDEIVDEKVITEVVDKDEVFVDEEEDEMAEEEIANEPEVEASDDEEVSGWITTDDDDDQDDSMEEEPTEEEEPMAEESIEEDEEEEVMEAVDEDRDSSDEARAEEPEDVPDMSEETDQAMDEQFGEATTVNDRFNKKEVKPSLAESLEQSKVTSIIEAISVNHRYMFTKELFDGDREGFVAAIDRIESCNSFDDAVEMLVQDYAKTYSWDMNSDEVKELLKVTFRRFR